jgi:hypothetical protein
VQLNRFTFNQHGLKGLNAQAVQRRCPIQHYRVLANDLSEISHTSGGSRSTIFLAALMVLAKPRSLELAKDKRLEKLQAPSSWAVHTGAV